MTGGSRNNERAKLERPLTTSIMQTINDL